MEPALSQNDRVHVGKVVDAEQGIVEPDITARVHSTHYHRRWDCATLVVNELADERLVLWYDRRAECWQLRETGLGAAVIATDVHVEHSDGSDDGLACRNNADTRL